MLVIFTMLFLMILLIAVAAAGVWWYMNREEGLPIDLPFMKKSTAYATADYSRRSSVVGKNEMKCMASLTRVAGKNARVLPKVRMNEVVRVSREFAEDHSIAAKLKSRHVDFLLCNPSTLEPIAAVNLERPAQRDTRGDKVKADSRTDSFSEDVLRLANVPLLKLTIADEYDPSDISRRLKLVLAGNATEQEMDIEDEALEDDESRVSALEKIRGAATNLQDRLPLRARKSA